MTGPEMAECMGTTRVAVTRALSEFRLGHLIALSDSNLVFRAGRRSKPSPADRRCDETLWFWWKL